MSIAAAGTVSSGRMASRSSSSNAWPSGSRPGTGGGSVSLTFPPHGGRLAFLALELLLEQVEVAASRGSDAALAHVQRGADRVVRAVRVHQEPEQVLAAIGQAGERLPEIGSPFGRDHLVVGPGLVCRTVDVVGDRDASVRAHQPDALV